MKVYWVLVAVAIGVGGCADRVESGPETHAEAGADAALPGPCCVDDAELQELVCLEVAAACTTCECCAR